MILRQPKHPDKVVFEKQYLTDHLESPQFKEYFISVARAKVENIEDNELDYMRIPVSLSEVAEKFPKNEAIKRLSDNNPGVTIIVMLQRFDYDSPFWVFNKFEY